MNMESTLVKRLTMAIIVLQFLGHTCFAQNGIIEYQYDENFNVVERIFFKEATTEKTHLTFEVKDNNPYYEAPGTITREGDFGERTLDYSNVESGLKNKILNRLQLSETTADHNLYGAFIVKPVVYIGNENSTTITYTIFYQNDNKEIIGGESKIYVFNDRGEIMLTHHCKDVNAERVLISENGKFMMIKFGFLYGESGERLKEGCRFIDLEKNVVLANFDFF